MLRTTWNGSNNKNNFFGIFGIFWSYVSKVRIKLAPGRGLYGSPHKIGLAELKKSPHKATFCQNTPLRGLSGVLRLQCLRSAKYFPGVSGSSRVSPISSANAIWNQNLGFQTLREVIHFKMIK